MQKSDFKTSTSRQKRTNKEREVSWTPLNAIAVCRFSNVERRPTPLAPLRSNRVSFFFPCIPSVASRLLTPSSTQDVDPHPSISLHPLVPQQPSWPQQPLCWISSHRPSRQKHWKPSPDRRHWSRPRRPPRPRLTRLLSLLLLFSLVSLLPTSLSFSFSSESGLTSPSS